MILSSPGSSSFVDLLGPPAEACGRADHVRAGLQGGAAGELGIFELLDRGELPVDEAGVGERPQSPGDVQRVGARGSRAAETASGRAPAPAGAGWWVSSRRDRAPARSAWSDWPPPGGRTRRAPPRRARCSPRSPGGRPCGRRRGGQSRPGNARRNGAARAPRGHGALSSRCPHPAEERLQADAMLIGGPHAPQLHTRLGEGGRHLSQQRSQFFLQVSCCAASARAWRGRGTCGLGLRRTS